MQFLATWFGDSPRARSDDAAVMDTRNTDIDVRSQLKLLDSKERTVSRRRRELHEQIDRLYLQAPLDDAESTLLDELEELERSISRERRRLHETIDALRAQIGLPRWREANELDNAA